MNTSADPSSERLFDRVAKLSELALAGDPLAKAELAAHLAEELAIDIAHGLHELDDAAIRLVFDLLDSEDQATVLVEAAPREQALLLMHVGDRGRQDLLESIEPDDAADVLESLEDEERERVLSGLDEETAQEIRALGAYEPETAGGLMTTLFVEVGPDASPPEVLAAIRQNEEAETINVLYVTEERRLVGVFSIRDLLRADESSRVRDFMTVEDIITVRPDEDRGAVVRRMETYHLLVVPVVDQDGRLLGIVTSDDALTASEDEASADVMALVGAGIETSPTRQSVLRRVRARLPWLLFTMLGGIAAAAVIRGMEAAFGTKGAPIDAGGLGHFKNYLPLVAGLAGNIGMQSSAIMVRGFATGEIEQKRIRGVIRGEVMVAAVVGCLCGVGATLISILSDRFDPHLNLTVGASIALASLLAGVSGTLIPTLSERLGLDPAISAGPFITMLNDLLGFFIFMAIALAPFWR